MKIEIGQSNCGCQPTEEDKKRGLSNLRKDTCLPGEFAITASRRLFSEEFGIKAIPTTVVFRDGEKIAAYEGPYSREALIERITLLLHASQRLCRRGS